MPPDEHLRNIDILPRALFADDRLLVRYPFLPHRQIGGRLESDKPLVLAQIRGLGPRRPLAEFFIAGNHANIGQQKPPRHAHAALRVPVILQHLCVIQPVAERNAHPVLRRRRLQHQVRHGLERIDRLNVTPDQFRKIKPGRGETFLRGRNPALGLPPLEFHAERVNPAHPALGLPRPGQPEQAIRPLERFLLRFQLPLKTKNIQVGFNHLQHEIRLFQFHVAARRRHLALRADQLVEIHQRTGIAEQRLGHLHAHAIPCRHIAALDARILDASPQRQVRAPGELSDRFDPVVIGGSIVIPVHRTARLDGHREVRLGALAGQKRRLQRQRKPGQVAVLRERGINRPGKREGFLRRHRENRQHEDESDEEHASHGGSLQFPVSSFNLSVLCLTP